METLILALAVGLLTLYVFLLERKLNKRIDKLENDKKDLKWANKKIQSKKLPKRLIRLTKAY